MQEEALAELDGASRCAATAARAVPVSDPEWHQGVVGIVAVAAQGPLPPAGVRVRARPATASCKGSGRSIAGFHLRDALDLVDQARARARSQRFGGHAFAAGLSLAEAGPARASRAPSRPSRASSSRRPTSPAAARPTATLAPGELDLRARAAPARPGVGPGLAAAALRRHVSVVAHARSSAASTRAHARRATASASRRSCSARRPAAARIRAVFRPEVNEWQGQRALQLTIEHWGPAPDGAGSQQPPPLRRRDVRGCDADDYIQVYCYIFIKT